jgi:hypothetical protein
MADKPQEKVLKVAMSIPTEGHTLPESYDNHLIHAQRMGAYETKMLYENKLSKFDKSYKFHKIRYSFYWYTAGRLLTQMAREKLVEHAIKENMDYIIFYDDDMILPPDFAIKMLETMRKHPKIDVLGALAFMRNPPHYPVIYSVIEGFDRLSGGEYYIRNFVKRYPKNSLVECDAVGFGGVCIKVELLKKMKAPYFMVTTNLGEDIWFCYKAKKEYGARIFMDTSIKMGHLKNPEVVDEEYFENWVKQNKHDLGPEAIGVAK